MATLPTGFVGSGVRSTTQLVLSAFLASAAGCVSLIEEILPPRLHCASDLAVEDALQERRKGHGHQPPALPPGNIH